MKTGARQFPFVAFCNFQMNEPGKKKQEGIEKFGKWGEGRGVD